MRTTGAPQRTIVAMGGGGFSIEPDNPLLDDHILALARGQRGRDRPRVCFVPTASSDSDGYTANFYAAFARRAEARTWPCSPGRSTISRDSCSIRTSSTWVAGTRPTCWRSGRSMG